MSSCPFPVGFGGFFQTDPSSIYAGTTWEQKKDVFILAAGETYPAGSTGGEAEHVLTIDEMPFHSHNFDDFFSGFPKIEYRESIEQYAVPMIDRTNPSSTSWQDYYTNNAGGSQPHNNMPPFYSMPFWVRTA